MKATDAYGDLLKLGRKVVTTAEAAARWRAEQRTTGKRLRGLEQAGLVLHLRRGLWSLDLDLDPFVLPPFLTAPLPAYVSFWSALARHEMIEQIPRQIWVASPGRPRRVATSIGTYEIHHLAPELCAGFDGRDDLGYVAEPEKALFDTVYVRAAAGSRAYFPELSLPAGFSRARLEQWVERITSARLRTLVSRRLHEVVPAKSRRMGVSRPGT
jgi:predicted transcriptional regulator of viral defense system